MWKLNGDECILLLYSQCVCVCVCLTKGMHYCESHSHKALQEEPDKGGLFTIIMHLIFAHQTLLPGLITRSLIQHDCLIQLCSRPCRCHCCRHCHCYPKAIVVSSTTFGNCCILQQRFTTRTFMQCCTYSANARMPCSYVICRADFKVLFRFTHHLVRYLCAKCIGLFTVAFIL